MTETAPRAAASVGVDQPVIITSTENTMMTIIGTTSTTKSRSFSRRLTPSCLYIGAAAGSITVQRQISTPYIAASTNPGTTPATSRSPTSVRPSVASSTVRADGGMLTASPPTPMIGPSERYLL